MRDLQYATYVPMQKWWLLISIYLIVNQRNEPITRKSMSKLAIQPSFRAVGQKLVEWQTFEKSKNERHLLTVIPPKPYLHASVVTYLWTPLLTSTLNWSVCDFSAVSKFPHGWKNVGILKLYGRSCEVMFMVCVLGERSQGIFWEGQWMKWYWYLNWLCLFVCLQSPCSNPLWLSSWTGWQ